MITIWIIGYLFWVAVTISTEDTLQAKVLSTLLGTILWPYFSYKLFVWLWEEEKYHNWRDRC